MSSAITDILYSIIPGLVAILAIILGLHKTQNGKFVILLLGLFSLIEVANTIWFELSLGRNVFLNSINDLAALSIILAMIYGFTKKSKLSLVIGAVFLILVAIFLFLIEGFNTYAPLAYSVQETGIILLCFSYFWFVFNQESELFIDKNTEFITVCIILVLNCGSLFTSIMILQITENEESYGLYDLQILLDSLANLALVFVLWLIYRRKKKVNQVSTAD